MKSISIVVLSAAVLVCSPLLARDIFPLNEVSGTSEDWFLSASGVLSFSFNDPGSESRTILDFDLDTGNNFAPDGNGFFDSYITQLPTFQIDASSATPLGFGFAYNVTAIDPYLRIFANDPSAGGASTGVEIARFKVTSNLDTLGVPFDTVGFLAEAFDFDLELEFVNPDASAYESGSELKDPDNPFDPGIPINDEDAWVEAFVNYLTAGGANFVGTIQLTGTGPLLNDAIQNGVAINSPGRTSGSFSMAPATDVIPEPTTMLMVGASLVALGLRRRSAKRA